MTFLSRSSLIAALLGVGFAGWHTSGTATLEANPGGPLQDTDGDLLPDCLEWVLMTNPAEADSDFDGTDDFLEAVQFQVTKGAAAPLPMDHEMRLSVGTFAKQIIVHLMLRVVPGEQVESLSAFLDIGGTRYPINGLLWNNIVQCKTLVHPTEGTYVIASAWLCSEAQLRTVLPCSLGITGGIGSRSFENGATLFALDGEIATLAPLPSPSGFERFGIHPIDANLSGAAPAQSGGSGPLPFWQSSKVCEVELVLNGNTGGGGMVATAIDAQCSGAVTLQCAPSCSGQIGRVLVLPGGLPFITGGSGN